MDKICEEEAPDEPHGIANEEATGYHQRGGQPHYVLAVGELHPMDHFQGQNRINKEKFTLNTHAVSVYMMGTVDAFRVTLDTFQQFVRCSR